MLQSCEQLCPMPALNGLAVSEDQASSLHHVAMVCRGELEVVDWGVSNATLEEVFIKITRDAGVRLSAFS